MDLLMIYFLMWIPVGLLWRFTNWFEGFVCDNTKIETPGGCILIWPLLLVLLILVGIPVGIYWSINRLMSY
jgi:hypothetical protein